MSEIQTGPQTPYPAPVAELARLVGEAKGEAERATHEDFLQTEALFGDVIKNFYRPTPSSIDQSGMVRWSRKVRPADTGEDSPRFYVATDPEGNLGTGPIKGKRAVRLHIEQGIENEAKRRHKPGSWGMSIELVEMENNWIVAIVSGGIDTQNGHVGLPVAPMSLHPASKDLLDWVNSNVGRPESLAPAATKKENRTRKLLAFLGLNS